MATQNPLLPNGQWVQYNPATDSPLSPKASLPEQTIGIVRQSFTQGDGPYYQVVWNPGSMYPKTALYHASQLTALDQSQANNILQQLAAGTYQPPTAAQPGASYQQPNIPGPAAPPSQQPTGQYTL